MGYTEAVLHSHRHQPLPQPRPRLGRLLYHRPSEPAVSEEGFDGTAPD
jgi:hypothetical protein